MRTRLRERADVDYTTVARSNGQWWEHRARTLASAGLIAFLQPSSILDLACGDGSLTFAAFRLHQIEKVTFCDISEPSITGVIERARAEGLPASASVIDVEERLDIAISNGERWDLALLCEFLEHVPEPERILRKTRQVATRVLASSPLIDPLRDDPNPEHLWAFDNDGYMEMLVASGWTPEICENLMLHRGYYNFQQWVCGHG